MATASDKFNIARKIKLGSLGGKLQDAAGKRGGLTLGDPSSSRGQQAPGRVRGGAGGMREVPGGSEPSEECIVQNCAGRSLLEHKVRLRARVHGSKNFTLPVQYPVHNHNAPYVAYFQLVASSTIRRRGLVSVTIRDSTTWWELSGRQVPKP